MNLVILGSTLGELNTLKAVKQLCPVSDYELIDLRNFNIGQYDYDHKINEKDPETEVSL